MPGKGQLLATLSWEDRAGPRFGTSYRVMLEPLISWGEGSPEWFLKTLRTNVGVPLPESDLGHVRLLWAASERCRYKRRPPDLVRSHLWGSWIWTWSAGSMYGLKLTCLHFMERRASQTSIDGVETGKATLENQWALLIHMHNSCVQEIPPQRNLHTGTLEGFLLWHFVSQWGGNSQKDVIFSL